MVPDPDFSLDQPILNQSQNNKYNTKSSVYM